MKYKNIPAWLLDCDEYYSKKKAEIEPKLPDPVVTQEIPVQPVINKTKKKQPVVYESESSEEEVVFKKKKSKPKKKPKKKKVQSSSEESESDEDESEEEEDFSIKKKNLKNLKKYMK